MTDKYRLGVSFPGALSDFTRFLCGSLERDSGLENGFLQNNLHCSGNSYTLLEVAILSQVSATKGRQKNDDEYK